MRGIILAVALVLGAHLAEASPTIAINARCAAELARDPVHVRTLRGELTHALSGTRGPRGYTLDVALVRLATTARGGELEVRAELRALLSDASGTVQWTSTSRATARGAARDRALLERDAVSSAARDLAKAARAHCCAGPALRVAATR